MSERTWAPPPLRASVTTHIGRLLCKMPGSPSSSGSPDRATRCPHSLPLTPTEQLVALTRAAMPTERKGKRKRNQWKRQASDASMASKPVSSWRARLKRGRKRFCLPTRHTKEEYDKDVKVLQTVPCGISSEEAAKLLEEIRLLRKQESSGAAGAAREDGTEEFKKRVTLFRGNSKKHLPYRYTQEDYDRDRELVKAVPYGISEQEMSKRMAEIRIQREGNSGDHKSRGSGRR